MTKYLSIYNAWFPFGTEMKFYFSIKDVAGTFDPTCWIECLVSNPNLSLADFL